MFTRHTLTAVALTFTAVIASTAQAAGVELVTNGGFETGTFSGFTLTRGSVRSLVGIDNLGPHNGNYSAYFGTRNVADTISQSLATTAGATYTVSFYLDSVGTSGDPASFIGSFGDTTFISLTGASPDVAFAPFVFELTASSSSTLISFSAYDNNAFYTLDDVSVQESSGPVPSIPEPSTYALMALGLAGIGWAARRARAA